MQIIPENDSEQPAGTGEMTGGTGDKIRRAAYKDCSREQQAPHSFHTTAYLPMDEGMGSFFVSGMFTVAGRKRI